jgi:hypothetical protein
MTLGRNANLNSTAVGAVTLLAAMFFVAAQAIAAETPERFRVWGKNAKADKYMGDPGLDTLRRVDVEATPGEKGRRFLVFTKSSFEIIRPDYVPRADERCTALITPPMDYQKNDLNRRELLPLLDAYRKVGFYYFDSQADNIYVRPAEDTADGMVPALHWEAIREGAKDRRYLATLEKLLAGKKGVTADEAAKFLAEIADKIELKNVDYDPIDGGRVLVHSPTVYDQWRAKIAELAEKLR